MALIKKVPLFELDVREVSAGRLGGVLGRMGSEDWLLVHKENHGYCALNRPDVVKLASGLKGGTFLSLDVADPILLGTLTDGELENELAAKSSERRRLVYVGENTIHVVAETAMAGGEAMDIGIFLPGGEAAFVNECPPVQPLDRPPGQPFLERDHDFSASPVGLYWICDECGERCDHPSEQRLRAKLGRESCGRCGARDLNP